MLGDMINSSMMGGGAAAPAPTAATPEASASAPGPGVSAGDASAVGNSIKDFITSGKVPEMKMPELKGASGDAVGGSSVATGQPQEKPGADQVIGQGLKDIGKGFTKQEQNSVGGFAPISGVPQMSNFNVGVPQMAATPNIVTPINPIQMPQLGGGIQPMGMPPMGAMSDIRTKYLIKRANEETNQFLTKVYDNIVKKRMK